MSVLRSPARGDMFVEIVVETPANLTKKQRELLEQFNTGIPGQRQDLPGIRRLLRPGERVLRQRA